MQHSSFIGICETVQYQVKRDFKKNKSKIPSTIEPFQSFRIFSMSTQNISSGMHESKRGLAKKTIETIQKRKLSVQYGTKAKKID